MTEETPKPAASPRRQPRKPKAAPAPQASGENEVSVPGIEDTGVTKRTEEMTNMQPSTPQMPEWQKLVETGALDIMKTAVVITDVDHNVVYANDACVDALTNYESVIASRIPGFSAANFVGGNIDDFHVNPAHQRKTIAKMKSTMVIPVRMDGMALDLSLTPFFDDAGKYTHAVGELQDVTNAVAREEQFRVFINEMNNMAMAHEAGDIDVEIDYTKLSIGPLQDACMMVNEMVKAHIETKKMVLEVFNQFAQGNFDADIPRLPRKKVFLNDIVDRSRANFRALTDEVSKMSDAIVTGNLDVKIDTSQFGGEYGRIVENFDRALESLNSIFSMFNEQVEQVSSTSGQMNDASQKLATNSQIASSSVDEVSASVEETDAQVRANAASAQDASKLVQAAAQVADMGNQKISQMVDAMEGISTSSQDIAKIIKVIDEIAFQTNLLALNAAVEAARAGQHGRGFAVVAQEVRNLAGRSAKAARETSDLIESSASRVTSGVRIASETSEAFSQIAGDIQKVRDIVSEIDRASGEQSRGVAQINDAIGEIAKAALATSQQAEELAATSAQMTSATTQMRNEIGRFKLRASTAAMNGMPDLTNLSPEMLAQINKMMAGKAPATAGAGRGNSDRDERGFGNF
ncbi:methyl-accepting chemotaxis protein [Donghicola tyrosinivorans]|uniref:Methyl-accepting chemotaxis protein n=2 Tax=Donghicola tyrosinivorans TaxID=1652492 RepID=A0A2T0WIE1_9RHOB|nr:methyl-accepting chemotaxis protein [Donghicola tyrosinivorans]